MNYLFKKNLFYLFILSLALAVACSSSQPKVAATTAPSSGGGENVSALLSELGDQIKKGRANHYHVYSPDWFQKAEKAYQRAVKLEQGGAEYFKVYKDVSMARTYLKHAQESTHSVETHFDNVLNARTLAVNAGAGQYEKDFLRAESRFLKMTRSVEKNDLKSAKKAAPDVIEAFNQLEVRAIKDKNLGKARSVIKQAEKKGAKKLTPKSYALTLSELAMADQYIGANPHSEKEIGVRSEKALFMAMRLDNLVDQTKTVRKMKTENIALWMEDMLKQMTESLEAEDKRDESFNSQKNNIVASAKEALNQKRTLLEEKSDMESEGATQIEALKKRIAFLEGRTKEDQVEKEKMATMKKAVEEKLAREREIRLLFTKIQAYFTPEEAEVYKKENHVIIRLRGIHFPVGKHIILPENYELLSKVQKAIRECRDPSVVIEGHTDSTGSKINNQYLSQKRAEAVQKYLVANRTLAASKITAKGFGPDRPLASNKTAKGRSVNRRIDVLIHPEMPF